MLRLWEALWAGVPGLNLFVVVAVLEHHRRRILRHAHVGIGRIGTTLVDACCLANAFLVEPISGLIFLLLLLHSQCSEVFEFDAMLKFCVELSGRLRLEPLLRDAEVLATYAGDAGRDIVATSVAALL